MAEGTDALHTAAIVLAIYSALIDDTEQVAASFSDHRGDCRERSRPVSQLRTHFP